MLFSEKGSILPTVLILMFLMSTLLIGTSYYIKLDASNNQILADSYKLKTMFNLAENALQQSNAEARNYEFVFNHGKVYAEYYPPTQYKLIGNLSNGYQADRMIDSPHLNSSPIVNFFEDDSEQMIEEDQEVFESLIKD